MKTTDSLKRERNYGKYFRIFYSEWGRVSMYWIGRAKWSQANLDRLSTWVCSPHRIEAVGGGTHWTELSKVLTCLWKATAGH